MRNRRATLPTPGTPTEPTPPSPTGRPDLDMGPAAPPTHAQPVRICGADRFGHSLGLGGSRAHLCESGPCSGKSGPHQHNTPTRVWLRPFPSLPGQEHPEAPAIRRAAEFRKVLAEKESCCVEDPSRKAPSTIKTAAPCARGPSAHRIMQSASRAGRKRSNGCMGHKLRHKQHIRSRSGELGIVEIFAAGLQLASNYHTDHLVGPARHGLPR